MHYRRLGCSDLESSVIAYGCMRLAGGGTDARGRAFAALDAALDAGINHFDHADIYGGGAAEALFGEWLGARPGLRDRLILTSKCGVRREGDPAAHSPKRYDLSAGWIRSSVEASLERLRCDRLDLFLLHRPDWLADPVQIADTCHRLHAEGRVRWFGVSNFSPAQVELLAARCELPLIVNQVELSLAETRALDDGTLDQCQRLAMTPMAWSPLRGALPAQDAAAALNKELEAQAARFGCTPAAIALAWLLAHPAGIVPVVGSTSPARIAAAARAAELDYGREDWYRLLEAQRGSRVA